MTKMEKLSVIILEDQVDAVLRSLGEAGTVQFVDIRGKMDAWKGSLVPYGIHVELRTRCSAIISKIEISLKELGLKSESLSQETLLITNERTEDLLAKVEEKLAEIPTDALAKSSTLLSKIDELAKNLEVKLQDVPVEDKSLHKKKPEDTLKEVENELPTETLAKSSTLLSKIDELAKSLEVKLQDVSTEDKGIEKTSQDELTKTSEAKLQDVSVGDRWLRKYQERALAEVEGKLTRIEQEIVASRLEDKEQKAKKNTPTQEDKNRIGKTLLRLRNSVMDIRLMFSAELSRSRGIVEKVRKSIEAGIDPQRTLKDLLFLRQTVNRELLVLDAKEKLAKTAKTVYFEVWVPETHVKEIQERIPKVTKEDCATAEEPVGHGEKTPVVPAPVPGFIKAFEKLTLASGYPLAKEISPIPLMAITFPILFGIMFADVGQGALFVLIGTLLTLAKKKIDPDKAGDIVRYLLQASEMFILLGICAIFWGFIFGEYFGPSGLLHPISLGRVGPFYIGGYEPTLEPMKMIRFAILVGALHISLGLVLKLINDIRQNHRAHAPIPVFWLWLLWGGFLMWAWWGGISSISKWFSQGLLMMSTLIIAPLILLIVSTSLTEGFTQGIGFGVEVFAETLSHTLSYGRLMALSLVHSVMNYLFLVLGGVEHGHFPVSSIPIVATGTIMVMIIEGLIVFVHTLRLHWIEWFSKFYSGEGIPFKPFKFT